MIYPFLCGTLHHQQEDDGIWSSSPVCSPRKSKRKKDTKNPYSTRGLDQFSALLAELEEKRQKIYSQTGSQSMVRFVYKNSNDCVPVVVNLKDKKEEKTKPENTKESCNIRYLYWMVCSSYNQWGRIKFKNINEKERLWEKTEWK
ncbi:hypothetical protein E1A91_D13G119500v1 [Gossypium mustelinum]|uniref:Uncharacterized protein n=1 Tax=Gossypium mustelinum TaxID=34275 RepID=A0A5D2S0F1_GOSMU|nr:hypothetical protein E1A91_D13G119500v1 [Gossypium mustelinum]